MKNYLTAKQAYELAINWQENTISEAVEATLKRIEEQAKNGLFCTGVKDPVRGTNLNRDLYFKAMESLGYVVDGINDSYIFWKWNKPKQ